ncbi:hypothetical protein Ahia01_001339200, partial [Argonauta hians]
LFVHVCIVLFTNIYIIVCKNWIASGVHDLIHHVHRLYVYVFCMYCIVWSQVLFPVCLSFSFCVGAGAFFSVVFHMPSFFFCLFIFFFEGMISLVEEKKINHMENIENDENTEARRRILAAVAVGEGCRSQLPVQAGEQTATHPGSVDRSGHTTRTSADYRIYSDVQSTTDRDSVGNVKFPTIILERSRPNRFIVIDGACSTVLKGRQLPLSIACDQVDTGPVDAGPVASLEGEAVVGIPCDRVSLVCPKCPRHFSDPAGWSDHLRERHGTRGMFKCLRCKKEGSNLHSIRCHAAKCNGVRADPALCASDLTHECETCGQRFRSDLGRAQHIRHRHPAIANERRIAAYRSEMERKRAKRVADSMAGGRSRGCWTEEIQILLSKEQELLGSGCPTSSQLNYIDRTSRG